MRASWCFFFLFFFLFFNVTRKKQKENRHTETRVAFASVEDAHCSKMHRVYSPRTRVFLSRPRDQGLHRAPFPFALSLHPHHPCKPSDASRVKEFFADFRDIRASSASKATRIGLATRHDLASPLSKPIPPISMHANNQDPVCPLIFIPGCCIDFLS